MRTVRLEQLPIVGALDSQITAEGLELRRVPRWARSQLVDPLHREVAAMPAGVRLEMRSSTRTLEVDVDLTYFQIRGRDVIPPTFDLAVEGRPLRSVTAAGGTKIVIDPDGTTETVPGPASTVRFDDLPGDPDVTVELWFPHSAVMRLRAVRVDDGSELLPLRQRRARWAHHGSSISHCLEAPSPTATWPAIVARTAGVDLVNLAMAGNAQLDPHVAKTIRNLDVDVISLKLGINVVNGDTMRERVFLPALHGFLDLIRDGHPATPLLMVTPILCPAVEEHPGPTLRTDAGQIRTVSRPPELCVGALTLRRIRELTTQVVLERQESGDANLHLADGLSLMGPGDVDELPDGLHPSPEGYRRMAERFLHLAFSPGRAFASAAFSSSASRSSAT
jgi:lysophospholipase L1-like esterase